MELLKKQKLIDKQLKDVVIFDLKSNFNLFDELLITLKNMLTKKNQFQEYKYENLIAITSIGNNIDFNDIKSQINEKLNNLYKKEYDELYNSQEGFDFVKNDVIITLRDLFNLKIKVIHKDFSDDSHSFVYNLNVGKYINEDFINELNEKINLINDKQFKEKTRDKIFKKKAFEKMFELKFDSKLSFKKNIKLKNEILMIINQYIDELDLSSDDSELIGLILKFDNKYSMIKQELLFLLSIYHGSFIELNNLSEFLFQGLEKEKTFKRKTSSRNKQYKFVIEKHSENNSNNNKYNLKNNNVIIKKCNSDSYKLNEKVIIKFIWEILLKTPQNYKFILPKTKEYEKNTKIKEQTFNSFNKIELEKEYQKIINNKEEEIKILKQKGLDDSHKKIKDILNSIEHNKNIIKNLTNLKTTDEKVKKDIYRGFYREIYNLKTPLDDLNKNSILYKKIKKIERNDKFFKNKITNYEDKIANVILNILQDRKYLNLIMKIFQQYSMIIYNNSYNYGNNNKFYFQELIHNFILAIGESFWNSKYKKMKPTNFMRDFFKLSKNADEKEFLMEEFFQICAMYYELYSINQYRPIIVTDENWACVKEKLDLF